MTTTETTITLTFEEGMNLQAAIARKAEEFLDKLIYKQVKRTPRNLAKCRQMLIETGVYDEIDADVLMSLIDTIGVK